MIYSQEEIKLFLLQQLSAKIDNPTFPKILENQ